MIRLVSGLSFSTVVSALKAVQDASQMHPAGSPGERTYLVNNIAAIIASAETAIDTVAIYAPEKAEQARAEIEGARTHEPTSIAAE